MRSRSHGLGQATMEEFARSVQTGKGAIILVPVGAMEPHGPHLGLATDVVISQVVADRAAILLQSRVIPPGLRLPFPIR